ncbi:MAG: type II toxin-antitoxin system RelE/ParE family toxin [Burkholderiaceae bacterium]
MTPSYRIRQQAESDLEQIWLYTFHEWGLEQADRYIRLMISRFSWLAENPQLGKRRDDIKSGYHSFPEGRHMIFYIITENGIDIIGIPHQRMDIIYYFD